MSSKEPSLLYVKILQVFVDLAKPIDRVSIMGYFQSALDKNRMINNLSVPVQCQGVKPGTIEGLSSFLLCLSEEPIHRAVTDSFHYQHGNLPKKFMFSKQVM